jgi:hypothetical protein
VASDRPVPPPLKEVRERLEDRLRQSGADRDTARRLADASAGRVYDQRSRSDEGRREKPRP